MMLAQPERGEKIEGHRRDEIVVLRRSDVGTVMRVARFQAQAQIFSFVRSRHITSLVSECCGRILLARLVVYWETQVHPATGRIGKYASVAVFGKEIREVCRDRVRPLPPGHDTLSRPEHKGHL